MLLAWFFYQLSFHPNIEQRIIEEMDTIKDEGISYQLLTDVCHFSLNCIFIF
jgi:cytochrome P450